MVGSPKRTIGEKMKSYLRILGLLVLSLGLIQPFTASAAGKPVVVSFKMTPDSIDLATRNTTVSFDLVVSNPNGIATESTQLILTDGVSISLPALLVRTDSPVNNKLEIVTFHGSLVVPTSVTTGVYTASAKPITALNADGSIGFSTDTLYATSTSKVVGAEDALLVRNNGKLNYSYVTFKGPAYDKSLGISYTNPKFNIVADPIWKVGESFNPSDYYELTVPGLSLKVKANTTNYCTSDGKILRLIAIGSCSFTVYTDETSEYQNYKDNRVVTIAEARAKLTFKVGTIPTQSSDKLPLSIQGPFIYSPVGLIIPVSATPTVCYPVGSYITITSGGICTLNYSSPGSADYLPSDTYSLTFEITRSAQTLTFNLPTSISLIAGKINLSATASSGLLASFRSQTPSICEVAENSLILKKAGTCQVTAAQGGSARIAPISTTQSILVTGTKTIKRIACIKNGEIKYFLSKKCPVGYKQKK